jgi:hypothetical protein
VRWAKFGNDCGWVPSNTVDVWVVNATDVPPNVNNYPTVFCEKCCWGNPLGSSSPETWTDCWVTALPFPFAQPTTNQPQTWNGSDCNLYNNSTTTYTAKNGRLATAAAATTGGAIKLCKDLGSGWYLPAIQELLAMSSIAVANNRLPGASIIPNDAACWSSTETNNYTQDNQSGYNTMESAYYVRANGTAAFARKTINQLVLCVWRP